MPHDQRSTRVSRPDARTADAFAARVRTELPDGGAQPWYVAEGQRGQQLLDQGDITSARAIFEGVLERLGDAPSYGRAVILSRLGRCFHLGAQHDRAITVLRQALDLTGKLAPSQGVKGLRGTLRSELGDALRAAGRYAEARKSYAMALKIAEELQDPRAQGVDQGQLAALAFVEGRPDEALDRCRAALRLIQGIHEPRLEAVAWHQLGRILQETGQWDEASRHYGEAARISEQCGDPAGALQSWNQLAVVEQRAGRPELAEEWLRKTIEADRQQGNLPGMARHLSDLADVLQAQSGRLAEARLHAMEALAIAQNLDPTGAEAWKDYGILAGINEKDAALTTDSHLKALLQSQAQNYRQLQHYGPRFVTALAHLQVPSCGRAVMLGRIGWCLHLGGRPDLAAVPLQDALEVAGTLGAGESVLSLSAQLHLELGDALRAADEGSEAAASYEAALRETQELEDLRGQAVTLTRLAALALAEGGRDEAATLRRAALQLLERIDEPELETYAGELDLAHDSEGQQVADEPAGTVAATATADFEVTIHDELITEYAFEPDLLIDGPRERRVTQLAEPMTLEADVRPRVIPFARSWVRDDGAARFRLDLSEPLAERDTGCTVMRRRVREVAISGNQPVLWRLIRRMDGNSTVAEILSSFGQDRASAERMLSALAMAGVVDVSGRAMGRFLHWATRKGVLPAGGLTSDEVLQLATDGEYREHKGATRIPLDTSVPERLRAFHALTRARRSLRDYRGLPLARSEFEALLSTACGVTGTMPWSGREVRLRAYPSSGALYAVEIYPVVFRVEGLEAAVYHYRSAENVLEVVRPGLDLASMVAGALPMEREMVSGAAAMICLVGSFPRHERKYGQGGYRMMVAESGHISQNLVLAATALGLSARPFGGVFDDLVNKDLGLDDEREQFLLGVLIGQAGGSQGA